LKPSAT